MAGIAMTAAMPGLQSVGLESCCSRRRSLRRQGRAWFSATPGLSPQRCRGQSVDRWRWAASVQCDVSDDGNSRDTYGEYFSLNENPHGVILAFSSRWKTTH